MARETYEVIQPWSWRMRRHWTFKLLACVLPLLVLALFLPTIVAKTPLRQKLVGWALPQFKGSVSIGGASLGWFSTISLQQVTVVDAQGGPLAELEQVSSDKTLLSLALDATQLGTFQLERPVVHLALRNDGSNLEDALAPLLAGESSAKPVAWAVSIANGSVNITAGAPVQQWRLSELAGRAQGGPGGESLVSVELAGQSSASNGPNSPLEARFALAPVKAEANVPAGGVGDMETSLRGTQLPLDFVALIARRFQSYVDFQGTAAADLSYSFKRNGAEQWIEVRQFSADNFVLIAPGILAERLASPKVTLGGRLGILGPRLQFDRTSLDCNLGQATLTGSLAYAELAGTQSLTQALQQEDYQLAGQIDIAELAKALPQTLRLRNDLQITSGQVRASFTSQQEPGGHGWQGKLETTNLEGVASGRRITWEQPISATLVAQQAAQGAIKADINCRSSFLTLLAHAEPTQGHVSADGDLDQLAQQLGQFLDLAGTNIAGKLRANIGWKPAANGRVALSGTVDTQQFSLALSGLRPWRENALHVDLQATGEAGLNGITAIESGSVKLVSGNDLLDGKLTQPISGVSASTAWPVAGTLSGQLETWLPRLQSWIELPGWDITGRIDLAGNFVLSPPHVQFDKLHAEFDKLHVHGPGLYVDEPIVKLDGGGTFDVTKQQFTSPVCMLAASAVAVRADQLAVNMKPGEFRIAGDLAFRGDLARLNGWFQNPQTPATQQFFGGLEGTASMTVTDGATQATLNAKMTDFTLANRNVSTPAAGRPQPVAATSNDWQAVWQEKEVALAGKARYVLAADTLELTDFAVDSQALRVITAGKIAGLQKQTQLDLAGKLEYDWQKLSALLKGYVGEGVQITGRESRSFAVRGPIASPTVLTTPVSTGGPVAAGSASGFPQELTADAALGWDTATAYGIALGKSELAARLEKGVVRITPLDVAVSGGKVKLAPWIDLNGTPYVARLDRGLLFENVAITPEMCATWMKYAAPALADATRAEGRFTLAVEGAAIPLTNPQTLNAAGTFSILQAQIGPGPTTEQLIGVAQQVKALLERKASAAPIATSSTWIAVPAQNIPLRVVDGKVYHERMQFQVKDLVITTTGAVGFDQSMSITAEIPIRDEWLGSDRLLAGLRGQVIRVPVGGTLSKPQVDTRVLGELAKQYAGSAARGLLEDQLKSGLNRLFQPQPQPQPQP